jgi:FkbM family methyltransferase
MKALKMPNIIQRIWHQFIQLMLRRVGVDARRYPPQLQPDCTERVFTLFMAANNSEMSGQLSDAEEFLIFCGRHAHESHAQLFQDLFVRWQLGEKKDGFFVEFGATDGIGLSNSRYLEEHLHWRGILAEPARCWHEHLHKNRTCNIDTRCVWTRTGEALQFNEASIAELSTVASFSDKDLHSASRQHGTVYEVQTVSLNDLLAENNAPATMDYLSIDTEGSELSILTQFDFKRYNFGVITVEHNNTSDRERIFSLLNKNGYQRKFTQFSKWDDWYVYGGRPVKRAAD